MSELVTSKQSGRIAVVTVNNPPVNALSPGVPEGIVDGVVAANDNPEVAAIVLIGAGRGFIAGADIKHLGKPRSEKARSVHRILEDSAKPIVAAIHGHALGGGLEVALECNYRVAVTSARVGLPEVLIGVIPGAGGTQRLPRVAGPEAALEMIVSGRHVPAEEARALGVLDAVVPADEDLETAAVAFAEQVAEQLPAPRVRDRNERLAEAADGAIFEDMRKKIARKARNQRAPYACIEAVEAAVSLPFEDGLAKERELFGGVVNADEAKALRYAFFSERAARNVPGVARGTQAREVGTVAVVGAGTMGGGIAMACANAGLDVRVLERDAESMERGMDKVRSNYATSVKRGSTSQSDADARLGRIAQVFDYADIAECDFVIEAVFEDLGVKRTVFEQLDAIMKPGAILATNSSALSIDAIAAFTKRPADVLGTHFFSPANVMKLLEVVRGEATAPDAVVTAMELGRRIDKVPAVCGNCYGFLANRSRAPFGIETGALILEGASPADVDAVMFEFGYPVGPFVVNDIAGIDVGYMVRQTKKAEDPDNYQANPVADRLYELGRYGQKTGAGFYRYEPGKRVPLPDPEVDAIIADVARSEGVERRQLDQEEILHRLLFSSVNEAARILSEGVAYRPSDVDVMWLGGFNFPRYRGGLMYWADQLGTRRIYDQIRIWEQRYGRRWAPAPLLQELAESNRSFAEWQAARAG
ncbi:MAG: 3-hydroxyacyl-CoA dehydrogenase NAD-binding domain-containing protein [Pseudomonadota bacterium]